MALMRLGTRMATVFDQRFAALGITQAQFRTLLAIWELGGEQGVAPSVLAEHLLLERATVTVLTTRLVEMDLLARAPGTNRRTFRLVLTAAGGEKLRQVIPAAVDLAQQTLQGVSQDDMAGLEGLLTTIEARVRAWAEDGDINSITHAEPGK
jgi:DNA-binding MarR family transcriptional regulator